MPVEHQGLCERNSIQYGIYPAPFAGHWSVLQQQAAHQAANSCSALQLSHSQGKSAKLSPHKQSLVLSTAGHVILLLLPCAEGHWYLLLHAGFMEELALQT
jgi:hypothetical protein